MRQTRREACKQTCSNLWAPILQSSHKPSKIARWWNNIQTNATSPQSVRWRNRIWSDRKTSQGALLWARPRNCPRRLHRLCCGLLGELWLGTTLLLSLFWVWSYSDRIPAITVVTLVSVFSPLGLIWAQSISVHNITIEISKAARHDHQRLYHHKSSESSLEPVCGFSPFFENPAPIRHIAPVLFLEPLLFQWEFSVDQRYENAIVFQLVPSCCWSSASTYLAALSLFEALWLYGIAIALSAFVGVFRVWNKLGHVLRQKDLKVTIVSKNFNIRFPKVLRAISRLTVWMDIIVIGLLSTDRNWVCTVLLLRSPLWEPCLSVHKHHLQPHHRAKCFRQSMERANKTWKRSQDGWWVYLYRSMRYVFASRSFAVDVWGAVSKSQTLYSYWLWAIYLGVLFYAMRLIPMSDIQPWPWSMVWSPPSKHTIKYVVDSKIWSHRCGHFDRNHIGTLVFVEACWNMAFDALFPFSKASFAIFSWPLDTLWECIRYWWVIHCGLIPIVTVISANFLFFLSVWGRRGRCRIKQLFQISKTERKMSKHILLRVEQDLSAPIQHRRCSHEETPLVSSMHLILATIPRSRVQCSLAWSSQMHTVSRDIRDRSLLEQIVQAKPIDVVVTSQQEPVFVLH